MSAVRPRQVAPLAALAAAVFLAGVGAAAALPADAPPVPPAVVAGTPPSPSPPPPAQPVPLTVRPAAAPAPTNDAGDPATWPSRQLAAQLVFSCVHIRDLGQAAAHAQAGIGGIVMLGHPRDRAVYAAGLAAARAAAPHGLGPMVASDEEGGRVQRLKGLLGALPSAAVMGTWPDAQIEQTAHDYGIGMRGLGVHLALSPVADLKASGGYPAATERAFSADPQRVAGASVAWSRGLDRAGVLSAVKHWPGHGQATDSHTLAPSIPALPSLEGADLLPFDAVLASGAAVVMSGTCAARGSPNQGCRRR